jgi:hypothetical protein
LTPPVKVFKKKKKTIEIRDREQQIKKETLLNGSESSFILRGTIRSKMNELDEFRKEKMEESERERKISQSHSSIFDPMILLRIT